MERPSLDKYYLDIALAVAARSSCLKKHYGAVIVNNNEIISTGYNGPPRGEAHCEVCTKVGHNKDMEEYATCPAVHAEQNAIISASRRDMLGGILYLAGVNAQGERVNAKPCEICMRLIKNSGLSMVITDAGVIYTSSELLREIGEN